MIELASRECAGLLVTLLWSEAADFFAVSVFDAGTGDAFELVVEDRNPLDVYYHPYAYAALRGVEYRLAA
jgi:hypothetical protein